MAMYPAARIQGIYAKMTDWGLTFVRCHPLSSRAQNRVDLLTRLNQCIAAAHLVFPRTEINGQVLITEFILAQLSRSERNASTSPSQ
jgi:hypothetical protein